MHKLIRPTSLLRNARVPFIHQTISKSTPRNISISSSPTGITVPTTGTSQHVNWVWLRDHCRCEKCIHPDNRQKLHSSADIPLDISPKSVQVVDGKIHISWKGTPHESIYDLDMFSPGKKPCTPKLWNHGQDILKSDYKLSWQEFVETPAGFKRGLIQLYDYGLLLLHSAPTTHNSLLKITDKFDHAQRTFYGETFDVKSVKKSTNIAYTNLFLGLHMDLMYFEAPPGLQILHSLQNSVNGGESFFSDAFAAANKLREEDAQAYKVLCETPVKFGYLNDGHDRVFHHKTIEPGNEDEFMRIYYAPPFQSTLSPDTPVEFYRALKKFTDFVESSEAIYETRLEAGDVAIFNNRRVLHARREFDSSSGDRWFEGAYVSWDDFKDKLRVFGRPGP
jgi:gamma-butyrobetaine dioxygenase